MSVVLFDLGGTLVEYWERAEFPGLLEQAIGEVCSLLRQEGLCRVPHETVWQRVKAEDHESPNHRVRPLEGRLARIFGLEDAAPELLVALCRSFLRPMLARGRLCEDTLPVLEALRARGVRTAIVSNTPWGSPASLWREELARLGLAGAVDAAAFCRDVGWRKPARPIFQFALDRVQSRPADCLFVGDDPRWDLDGPQAMGIRAVLVDRRGVAENAIRSLHELWARLGAV